MSYHKTICPALLWTVKTFTFVLIQIATLKECIYFVCWEIFTSMRRARKNEMSRKMRSQVSVNLWDKNLHNAVFYSLQNVPKQRPIENVPACHHSNLGKFEFYIIVQLKQGATLAKDVLLWNNLFSLKKPAICH